MLEKTAKVITIVIVMGVLCLAATELFAEEGWIKAKESKGVVVFTRLSEGSKIKEFKAKTEIEASLRVWWP